MLQTLLMYCNMRHNVEQLVQIIDTKDQVLRTKVKVQSENHEPEEATSEHKDQVQKEYPHLLPKMHWFHLEDQMLKGGRM